VTVDHDARLALLVSMSTTRKTTRAAKDFYDAVCVWRGDDPGSHVAAAARAVYARHDAGAVDRRAAGIQLAALLAAWRACR
jgi:hypothetical protein